MFVCLSVLYAFSPCNTYGHQTFHGPPLGPEEGRQGIDTINGNVKREGWVEFHSSGLMTRGVTKLSRNTFSSPGKRPERIGTTINRGGTGSRGAE